MERAGGIRSVRVWDVRVARQTLVLRGGVVGKCAGQKGRGIRADSQLDYLGKNHGGEPRAVSLMSAAYCCGVRVVLLQNWALDDTLHHIRGRIRGGRRNYRCETLVGRVIPGHPDVKAGRRNRGLIPFVPATPRRWRIGRRHFAISMADAERMLVPWRARGALPSGRGSGLVGTVPSRSKQEVATQVGDDPAGKLVKSQYLLFAASIIMQPRNWRPRAAKRGQLQQPTGGTALDLRSVRPSARMP